MFYTSAYHVTKLGKTERKVDNLGALIKILIQSVKGEVELYAIRGLKLSMQFEHKGGRGIH